MGAMGNVEGRNQAQVEADDCICSIAQDGKMGGSGTHTYGILLLGENFGRADGNHRSVRVRVRVRVV